MQDKLKKLGAGLTIGLMGIGLGIGSAYAEDNDNQYIDYHHDINNNGLMEWDEFETGITPENRTVIGSMVSEPLPEDYTIKAWDVGEYDGKPAFTPIVSDNVPEYIEDFYLSNLFKDNFVDHFDTKEQAKKFIEDKENLSINPYKWDGKTKYAIVDDSDMNIVDINVKLKDRNSDKYFEKNIEFYDAEEDGVISSYQLKPLIEDALDLNNADQAQWKLDGNTLYIETSKSPFYQKFRGAIEFPNKALQMLREYTGE